MIGTANRIQYKKKESENSFFYISHGDIETQRRLCLVKYKSVTLSFLVNAPLCEKKNITEYIVYVFSIFVHHRPDFVNASP